MRARPETDAHILLADISGYTRFLHANRLTLAHATQIVSALLEAVIAAAPRPMRPHKLEGDAVLLAAWGEGADAAAPLAPAAFFQAFYRRRAALAAANTCPCEACRQIPDLDLKIIAHHGRLLRHRVGRFEELAGPDLILAHRLLKNRVQGRRYLLCSAEAWRVVGGHAMFAGLPVERWEEDCEGLGAVPVVVLREAAPLLGQPLPQAAGRWAKTSDFIWKHVVLLPLLGPWLLARGRRRLAPGS
ncbi:hypothetical protein GALL_208630 [mine drainage metagenome]|uniref:Guanylate cyclase domain-containing protein n=1 Tax=mine drainage metagenome TaxID=410659 RepID=A0A1J5S5U8_9ZZZZ